MTAELIIAAVWVRGCTRTSRSSWCCGHMPGGSVLRTVCGHRRRDGKASISRGLQELEKHCALDDIVLIHLEDMGIFKALLHRKRRIG